MAVVGQQMPGRVGVVAHHLAARLARREAGLIVEPEVHAQPGRMVDAVLDLLEERRRKIVAVPGVAVGVAELAAPRDDADAAGVVRDHVLELPAKPGRVPGSAVAPEVARPEEIFRLGQRFPGEGSGLEKLGPGRRLAVFRGQARPRHYQRQRRQCST